MSTLLSLFAFSCTLLWSLGLGVVNGRRHVAGVAPASLVVAGLVYLAVVASAYPKRPTAGDVATRALATLFGGFALAAFAFGVVVANTSRIPQTLGETLFIVLGAALAVAAGVGLVRRGGPWTRRWLAGAGICALLVGAYALVPRPVRTTPPGPDEAERVARSLLVAESGLVRILGVAVVSLDEANGPMGQNQRRYRCAITVEMLEDGFHGWCSGPKVTTSFTRVEVQDAWGNCRTRRLAKGAHEDEGVDVVFYFEPGVGWIGSDDLVH